MHVMFLMGDENSQIVRTKVWLYDALTELMDEKPFASITVSQICKRADVSRAVFYNHYANKEELLQEILSRIVEVYRVKLQRETEHEGQSSLRTLYRILFQELLRSRTFFIQLYDNGHIQLLTKFLEQIHDECYRLSFQKEPPDHEEYRKHFIPYYANTLCMILLQWMRDPKDVSAEQMADIAWRLFQSVSITMQIFMNRGEPDGVPSKEDKPSPERHAF